MMLEQAERKAAQRRVEAEPVPEPPSRPEPNEGVAAEAKPAGAKSAEAMSAETKSAEARPAEAGHPAEKAMAYILAVVGLDLQASVSVQGDEVEVEIEGPDAELLLEGGGKALSAMEHLLPKVLRGISEEKFFCHIDSLGFREKRQLELESSAREAADVVRGSGEPKTLDPLNPAERRIVHMVLADDPDVETESKGRGYLKKLTIWPT